MIMGEARNEVRINERVSEDFIVPAGGSRAHLFPSPAKRFVRDVEQCNAKYEERAMNEVLRMQFDF